MTSEEEDRCAQAGIQIAKEAGAKTARHAAEIIMGRGFTEREWEQYKPAWEKNWVILEDAEKNV